jgi:hypothetical protein
MIGKQPVPEYVQRAVVEALERGRRDRVAAADAAWRHFINQMIAWGAISAALYAIAIAAWWFGW